MPPATELEQIGGETEQVIVPGANAGFTVHC